MTATRREIVLLAKLLRNGPLGPWRGEVRAEPLSGKREMALEGRPWEDGRTLGQSAGEDVDMDDSGGWAGRPVVLVIDDDEQIRHALHRRLERLGYAPVTCSSAEHGLGIDGELVASGGALRCVPTEDGRPCRSVADKPPGNVLRGRSDERVRAA